ncbi:SIMPL domain-containing protein [Salinirubellus salinus]|uniref:SIMPL domain-containing protein n=1 Tax=Salinirubellus salinus TaxID=1364945 RepID=A0A9E7UAK8_9EURY|nr:SIMPL domain-containing protein [Salinirubellus salinus]UWM53884.1 SIMPL domain-containing protein [Salinirubellus salinus]
MRPDTRIGAALVALLVLLAGCVGAGSPTPLAQSTAETTEQTADSTPSISVSGAATVEAAPDLAVVRVAVEREADTADRARGDVATAVEEMREALRDAGVPDANVTTESFGVFPQYQYDDGERTLDGYRAVHSFRIEVSPDRAGEIVDVAVGNGADRVAGVAFTLSEEKRAELRQEALTLAVENARTDAETMAAAAGVSVGPVQSLSTSNSVGPVSPVEFARGDAAESRTVLEPGDVSVTASVSVVYGIDAEQ